MPERKLLFPQMAVILASARLPRGLILSVAVVSKFLLSFVAGVSGRRCACEHEGFGGTGDPQCGV